MAASLSAGRIGWIEVAFLEDRGVEENHQRDGLTRHQFQPQDMGQPVGGGKANVSFSRQES